MSAEPGSQERLDAPREVVAGRYELTRRLARGGMGEVFCARDRSTGKLVALKRLLASALSQRGPATHFRREYHVLSELRHPRIIEVYDYGVDRDVPYYTMELLDGQDLRDLSPLPYREACRYLRDVASSLALLHARRLLHRDVSPRNVRRTSDGHCKLIDFGAMIPFGVPPNVTGTAPCVAPEALHGATLDQRSDLYSLGALAYSVLTGRHGHAVSQLDELPVAWSKTLKRPKRITVDIPDELDELVMSLMSLDPMKRPKSAAEVIDWLSAIGQLEPDDAPGVAQSFFTGTQLCGRGHEVEELSRHVQRAARGAGGALVIEGKVGTGKTRMLSEASVIAQTGGLVAVQAAARGSSRTLAQELVLSVLQVMPLEAEAAGARRIAWPRMLTGTDRVEHDPAEQRARLQQSLLHVFTELASVRPLVLCIDDVDRADEVSLALIAGLAHTARQLPLLVIASRTLGQGHEGTGADALRGIAARVRIGDLMRGQSADLVSSIFGAAPNLDLLNDWLFRVARGNPKLTVELAEHLFKRELVRYVEGSWVLPSDPITLDVPHDLAATWSLRLAGLSAQALELAELLSVYRGGVSTELCIAAGRATPEVIFDSFEELVRAGVVENAGTDYVFAQQALKRALEEQLEPARRKALHARWAEALLAEHAQELEVRLEAGWHLVHTDEELRGALMLAEVAPAFVDVGISLESAKPALEKALEVHERLGSPLDLRLRLRSALIVAGYLYDYRLAFRYGDETLVMLHELTGLAFGQRVARYLGVHLGLWLGFLFALVRRAWTSQVQRGPSLYVALLYFARSAMGLMGVRATSLDAPGTAAIFEKLELLRALPRGTAAHMIYASCKTLALQMQGREADLRHASNDVLRELRGKRPTMMNAVEHRAILVGMLTADGVNESYREASEALKGADLLEGLGTRLALGGALRIRMIYYARRGDSDRAEEYRRQIALHAIQGGTVWQGEWFSVPLEGMASATWTDLVGLRRSLEQLERLETDVPALRHMGHGLRISYHFRRGEYARGAELGESYIAEHAPRTLVGWPATYGLTALCWCELGQAQRAKELCEAALAQVTQEDLSYFVMYSTLEVGYAAALALCGERTRSKEIMNARIERLRAHGEHASLVNLYQYQARIARLVDDRVGLSEALRAMREAALTSGLPAVILLADRVAELRSTARSSPLPPPHDEPANDVEPGTQETAMTAFLVRKKSGRKRSGSALWFLARYVASEELYLYRLRGEGLKLMAAVSQRSEPRDLGDAVARELRQPTGVGVVSIQGAADDTEATGVELRFRIVPVPSTHPEQGYAGALAILEGRETSRDVPAGTLDDIARLLAQDIEAEETAQPSYAPNQNV